VGFLSLECGRAGIPYAQCVHICCIPKDDNPEFLATLVYGNPTPAIHHELWEEMKIFAETVRHQWVVVGEFNVYLDSFEKSRGGGSNRASMERLTSCLHDCSLHVLGFKGPPFT